MQTQAFSTACSHDLNITIPEISGNYLKHNLMMLNGLEYGFITLPISLSDISQ
jgi:hypothetical protein